VKLSFETMFAIGAFDALRTLREQTALHNDRSLQELSDLLRSTNASVAGLDFSTALVLHDLVPLEAEIEIPHMFYRSCIRAVILDHSIWSKSITLGRSRFFGQLSRDELLCFRAASLANDPPDREVVVWWDEMAAASRQDLSAKALARARQAEELTLMREISRLTSLGIQRQPKWIAIEDNTAGYDVLSFDLGEYEPKNRLIEVKSTVASPLRFFLTRNEWEKALKYGDSYHFHVWDMSPEEPRLYERTAAQIAPHIPKDEERGKWANAEIPLGATG
jgi:Domain of unknown function (DUF3883)